MKRKVFASLACGLLALGLSGCNAAVFAQVENVRESAGIVESVEGHITTVRTCDGNEWLLTDFPCKVGAECVVVFDTLGTDDLTDDEIIDIQF